MPVDESAQLRDALQRIGVLEDQLRRLSAPNKGVGSVNEPLETIYLRDPESGRVVEMSLDGGNTISLTGGGATDAALRFDVVR